MMNKKMLIGLVVLVLIVIFGAFLYNLHNEKVIMRDNCGVALTQYNVQVLYDGKQIEGQYYWINAHDYWTDIEKIDSSGISFGIINDSSLKDTSIKIVKLDRNTDLTDNGGGSSDIYNLNYVLDNDSRYARGKTEITQARIMEAVRQYSIATPEYYEIKNVFTNEPFMVKNVTIDLKTGMVVNSNSVEDKNLWMPCEY
ncbi:MAG: hypothetical protein Q7R87_02445 [Nanoarchaeota archaeon]|nr:hypothetical protein [Nanoarchaeota archaeon]